ncbi:serine--tRNA ligase [Vulcanimicrobium alpinum]|uniref:Serine--tRNA ligase n=1 Tax=Vulcanimicrobium alpinum TaxID=3016050 RepID=A0AAN1XY55_UNVUL|nr:serine--tRNA ligase [Vulcanimicrobium alpinum]BDE07104.1 serine--tRNA ligase [Vulcanimicrobium alpinum]
MLNLELLRREPDHVRVAARRRGGTAEFVDRVLALDAQRRAATTAVESRKAEKNALTAQIANAADKKAAAGELRPRIAELDAQIAATGEEIPRLDETIERELAEIPNLLDPSVPDGSDEAANVEIRRWGTPPAFGFTPKPHWEIGEALEIFDFERAAKLSGARFAVLRGAGARLSRALVQFFLDRAARNAYVEINPPLLVTRSTMWSTGQLSKFADQMYVFEGDDAGEPMYLIPTAEVPLTAMHRDEILAGEALPLQYAAYTPCFRKEAGAAGRDTRGLVRQHQFEKVELMWVSTPERSFDDLETLTRNAAGLLEELGLAHRVMLLCAGDVGFNAAKTYDVEVWLPGAQAYREISSCSNCTDFQARRSAIRYRPEPGAKPQFAHTLNGSGLAVGRTLLALIENYQRADGGVDVPTVLRPFAGFASIEPDGSVLPHVS